MKYTLIIPLIIFTTIAIGQPEYYIETKEDAYLPLPDAQKKLSPRFELNSAMTTTVQVNTTMDGMNIFNDAANEPSLAINPLNPDEMVIGWRQFDNIESNFRQAGIAYSQDGGLTWVPIEPLEAGIFRSDPVLCTNSEGTFFYNSLTEDFSCDVFLTDDPANWEMKTPAFGGDKQWMVVDNTPTNSNGNIYAYWNKNFTSCDESFTRSFDGGLTFESCSNVLNNPLRGTLAVGPEGSVYTGGAWSNTFRALRSDSAKNPDANVMWESNTTVDLKGDLAYRTGPNPSGMLGQVWIATDHSESSSRSHVYLTAPTDRTNNNGDPCDIMFSRSTDKGASWSEAINISDDNSIDNWQWFGTISVAPNGRIDVVWLDTRDNPGTFLSSLYYSHSLDSGESWSTNERLSSEFDPHVGWPNQEKMGDYFHMISTDEYAFLAWAGTFNGEQDIYFSKIEPEVNFTSVENNKFDEEIKFFPNPFDGELFLRNNLKSITKLVLFDANGREITYQRIQNSDTYKSTSIFSNSSLSNLEKGIYFIRVDFEDEKSQFIKVVK